MVYINVSIYVNLSGFMKQKVLGPIYTQATLLFFGDRKVSP